MYEQGLGVGCNLSLAFELYRRSAESGEFLAQIQTARMYRLGRGIQTDREAAREWYIRAMTRADSVDAAELVKEARDFLSGD